MLENLPLISGSRTGRPIKHSLVAVNVVASTARVADAFATAFMILGPSEGCSG